MEWIQVDTDIERVADMDRGMLNEEYERILKPVEKFGSRIISEEMRTDVLDKLFKKAIEVGDISGKWIIYAIEEDIDRLWNSIAIMTYQGRLGPSAKVSTNA